MARTITRTPVNENTSGASTFNAGEILDRTKELFGLESDAELAALLGKERNVIAMWRKRGKLDMEAVLGVVISQKPEANVGWVLTGTGSMILVMREGDTRDLGVDLSSPNLVEHIEDLVTLLKQTMGTSGTGGSRQKHDSTSGKK